MSREVPDEWASEPLKSLFSLHTPGFWGQEPNGSGDVKVLRATNLTKDNKLDLSRPALRNFPEKKLEQKALKLGDIILERSGGGPTQPVGRVGFFDGSQGYSASNFMQIMRSDAEVCVPKFCYYLMAWLYETGVTEKLQKATTGIRNLDFSAYLQTEIKVPPLNEQRRIAEILSSVDDAIAATRTVIEQTRKVKQGVLERLLTKGIGHTRFKHTEIGEIPEAWQTGRVDSFFTLQRGFDITEKQSTPGEYPVVSSSGISYFHSEAMVSGPAVITGRKGKLGQVYFIETPCWPHDTTLWVKDFKGNEAKFVYWFLRSLNLDRFDAATAVPTLNRNVVHAQNCAFPPREEQFVIAGYLDGLESTELVQENNLRSYNDMKSALMSDLLTGRKRVTEALPMAAE